MTTLAINLKNNGDIESMAGATHIAPAVEKIGNEYTITGVNGLASSGWRMSIPAGDDGLPLFAVDSEQIDGGVKIITSDDIPDGRLLTLRFDVDAAPVSDEDDQAWLDANAPENEEE